MVDSIVTTALIRSARIRRKIQDICWHSESNERPPAGVKNSPGILKFLDRDRSLNTSQNTRPSFN